MTALLKFFEPLRHAAVAFFRHDLVLRRSDGAVRIELQEPTPSTNKRRLSSRDQEAERRDRDETQLMLSQLAELLNAMPETRPTLRHLCLVEQALAKKGLRALHKLPLEVLEPALDQLEGLVTNWSPVGLANLRSKMAVAIIDREHMDPDRETDAYKTAAVLDSPMEESLNGAALPEVVDRSDDEALAAAYAALGHLAPSEVQTFTELGSPSARAMAPVAARATSATSAINAAGGTAEPIRLRELQT